MNIFRKKTVQIIFLLALFILISAFLAYCFSGTISLFSSHESSSLPSRYTQSNPNDPNCGMRTSMDGTSTTTLERVYKGYVAKDISVNIVLSCGQDKLTISGSVNQTIEAKNLSQYSMVSLVPTGDEVNHFGTDTDFNDDGYKDLSLMWNVSQTKTKFMYFMYNPSEHKFDTIPKVIIPLEAGYYFDVKGDLMSLNGRVYSLFKAKQHIADFNQPGSDGYFNVGINFKDYTVLTYRSRGSGAPLTLAYLVKKSTGEDTLTTGKDKIRQGNKKLVFYGANENKNLLAYSSDTNTSESLYVLNVSTMKKTKFPFTKEMQAWLSEEGGADEFNAFQVKDISENRLVITNNEGDKTFMLAPAK